MMKPSIKGAALICAVQIVAFAILCINIRAVAQADYLTTAVSDGLVAAINFFVIKRIAQTGDSTSQWIGYIVGSVTGSMVGIYISKNFL